MKNKEYRKDKNYRILQNIQEFRVANPNPDAEGTILLGLHRVFELEKFDKENEVIELSLVKPIVYKRPYFIRFTFRLFEQVFGIDLSNINSEEELINHIIKRDTVQ